MTTLPPLSADFDPETLWVAALERHQAGDFAQAAHLYGFCIARDPTAIAYGNRGAALLMQGELDAAVADLDRAIALDDEEPHPYCNRGMALLRQNRPQDALADLDRALTLYPNMAPAHHARAGAMAQLGRYEEALQDAQRAAALDPSLAEAHDRAGWALGKLGRPEEALASLSQALQLKPNLATAWINLGKALADLERDEEALFAYDRAVGLAPESAEAKVGRAHLRLRAGDFSGGLPDYEHRGARLAMADLAAQQEIGDLWTGELPPPGETLLVHWEQDLGDSLQFCRYLKLAKPLFERVVFACQPGLSTLLGTLDPDIAVVETENPIYHRRISLMSLPMALGARVETIPGEVPYLHADPDRVEAWRQRIGRRGFKVGIAWRGSDRGLSEGRAMPLELLAPLAAIPGVRLISLQKDGEEARNWPLIETLGPGFDAGPDRFLDTAAVIETLDLVISIDTAVAHLAGALGKPVWIALRRSSDWRWLKDRDDTPWYPTARLFRQIQGGGWPDVSERIKAALTAETRL